MRPPCLPRHPAVAYLCLVRYYAALLSFSDINRSRCGGISSHRHRLSRGVGRQLLVARDRYRVDSADDLFLFKIAIPPEKPYVFPSSARTVSTAVFLSLTGSASKKALRLGDSGRASSIPTDDYSVALL